MSEELTQFERTGNPYPGLRPFETEEYNLFFGREGQSDELLARLSRTRFLAVVGTSGSGKSSLIRAGLLPALYGGLMAGTGSAWRIAVMRPGHDPLGNLARALAEDSVLGSPEVDDAVEASIIETTLRRSTLGLVDAVRQARLPAGENVLVVVDQFEELFRFRAMRDQQGTDDEAAAFVKLLLEAPGQRDVALYVVLTMRSDFLGDCAQFQGLPEAINDGQYLIPRMTRDERRFAIVGPVRVARARMTEPLVNRLLNDVGDNPDQLPILQHALMRTWDEWRGKRPEHAAAHTAAEKIDVCCYEAIGGMSGGLSRHADEAYADLPDDRSRHLAELLFKALTERGPDNREIRRPTRLREICEIARASEEEVAAVVEVFRREGRSFLMPPEGVGLGPDTIIDISHESLIRNWGRLKEWVKEEADAARIYRRLADAAAAHRAGESGLLDDVTLGWVNRWRDRYEPNRAWGLRYHPGYDEAMAYLEESRASSEARVAAEGERERRELAKARAYAEEQRRSARRLRWLLAGMGVMFLLSLGTAAYAFTMSALARNSAKAAVQAREVALKAQADAQKSEREARDLAESLKTAKQETDKALEAEKEAVNKQEKALKEQQAATKRAEGEADKARKAERAAIRATEAAKLNAEVLNLSRERTVNHLEGIAAFRRGNYQKALGFFEEARRQQETERAKQYLARHSSGEPAGRDDSATGLLPYLEVTLGADLGTTQSRLGRHQAAISQYEIALERMLGLRPSMITGAGGEELGWLFFEIRHLLGHAYREQAKTYVKTSAGDEKEAEEIQRKTKEANDKAKEAFKAAVGFQERLLKGPSKEAAAHVGGFESLARLHRDLGEFKEAEPVYRRLLEIRREGRDYEALGEALQETAKFYAGQSKYREAESLFEEAIGLQKSLADNEDIVEVSEDSPGRDAKLAELYGELAEVYAGHKDEAKTALAFRLVSLYQSLGRGDRSDVERLLEIGDSYERLGKFKWAASTYQRALGGSGTDDAARATTFMKLAAVTYKHLKNGGGAETLYRQALRLAEKPGGSPDLRARVMQQLGVLYVEKSDRAPAAAKLSEDWLNRALSYWEQQQNQREIYSVLADLASLYRQQKQTDKLLAADRRRVEAAAAILARSRHPRQLVADAQGALTRAGFPAGPSDGTIGPRTMAALRSFQESKRLPVTGQLDAATVKALNFDVDWGRDGGGWDAGRYAEAFGLYISAVGDEAADLLASGKRAEAAEAAKRLLDPAILGVGYVASTLELDSYVAFLEHYRELLEPAPGPSARDMRAELIAQARERRSEVEQIARKQDDYQQQTRPAAVPTVAPSPTPTPTP